MYSIETQIEKDRSRKKVVKEECVQINKKGILKLSFCLKPAAPSVCIVDHRNSGNGYKLRSDSFWNLCPYPWVGFTIRNGQLICMKLIENPIPINWNEAEKICYQQQDISGATFSLYTVEK